MSGEQWIDEASLFDDVIGILAIRRQRIVQLEQVLRDVLAVQNEGFSPGDEWKVIRQIINDVLGGDEDEDDQP